MEQKEKSSRNFCALRWLSRSSIYFKSLGRKFFQLKYPNKIKEADCNTLKPIQMNSRI